MNDQKEWSISNRLSHAANFLWMATVEIYQGVAKNRIPAHRFCYPGILVAVALLGKLDLWLASYLKIKWHPSHSARIALIYFFLTSGWIAWGVRRAYQRNELLQKLKDAFESCKWKCNGRYPSLIEDVEVDDQLRKLRLKTNGLTKSEFQAGTEKLEAQLNFTVVKLAQEENDKSRIDILYTFQDLARSAVLTGSENYADGEIPIGVSHGGEIRVNFRDIGHMMLSGATGTGKSNCLKVISRILAKNNPEAQIVFLDFKGGMESADLKAVLQTFGRNVSYCDGTRAAIQELGRIGTELEGRLEILKKCGAVNFDQYLKKKLSKKSDPTEASNRSPEKRTYLIIDEVAQLYAREPGLDPEAVEMARAAVNRIARQGRAAGIHMVVATQKPDASSFDQTVKANLPAVLCFPMVTQAASVSAIGTARAFELNPEIKGRAIWKYGPKLQEVQTYLFT